MPKAKPKRKDVVTKAKSIKFPENDDDEPQMLTTENNDEETINDIDQQNLNNTPTADQDDDDAPEEVTFTSSKQLSSQQRQTEKEARRLANEAAKKRRATATGTAVQQNKQIEAIDSQIRQAKEVLEQLDELQLPEEEEELDDNWDDMELDEESTEYFADTSQKAPQQTKGRYWKQVGNLNVVALEAETKGLLPAPGKTQQTWRKSTAELEDMLQQHFYGTRLKRMSAVRFAAKGQYNAPDAFVTKTL